MTSTIKSQLRPDVDLVEIFRSLFPCGSITGAPKIATMKIIKDLESQARGVYCGTVGLLLPKGRRIFNVAIRTIQLHQGKAIYGVGGGIPWLVNLERTRRVDEVKRVYGIFNGTSNFILDNMYRNNQEFDSTLKTAQELGYAEADPSADVDGGDVVNKIILSNALAFDIHVQPDFPTYSMRNITKNDIDYLKQYDLAVKYIGETNVEGGKYETSVMLSIFGKESQEAAVPLNNNIISLDGSFIGELKFYGQGAGKFPTGNAIVQDIVDINEGSTRVDVVIKNDLSYSEELTRRNYLVRSSVELSGELVESVEEYKGNFYVKTKEISLKQLTDLVAEVKEKDSKVVVAKFHK